jgi:hypothetical protein
VKVIIGAALEKSQPLPPPDMEEFYAAVEWIRLSNGVTAEPKPFVDENAGTPPPALLGQLDLIRKINRNLVKVKK